MEMQQYVQTVVSTNRSFLVELYFLDQAFNVSDINPKTYFVNNDNRVTFTVKRGVDRVIEFGSF